MTDSAFSIEELEELYVLFKVRTPGVCLCMRVCIALLLSGIYLLGCSY